MGIFIPVFLLFTVSLCFAYKVVGNGTIIPDQKIIDGELVMDVTIEGGVLDEYNNVVNGTLVYGKYPTLNKRGNDIRQTNPVLTIYTDNNLGGSSLTIYSGSLSTNPYYWKFGTTNPTFYNSVSSLIQNSISYVVTLTVDPNCGGASGCWTWRTPVATQVLGDYGANDVFNCAIISLASADGIQIYADSSMAGKSAYLPSGNPPNTFETYSDISSASSVSNTCGNLPNYAMSSFVLLPHTGVYFWPSTNFNGARWPNSGTSSNPSNYINSGSNYYMFINIPYHNDEAASAEVYNA
jgi:hypothetical protein